MDILATLYLATGIAFAIAFLPQIRMLWRDQTGAASISLASWGMFSACSVITVLYAWQVNGDPYFIATTALCAAGNLAVFSLASYRRMQQQNASRVKITIIR